MFKKRIYLDYASLTPIEKSVLRTTEKYYSQEYANPSSWFKEGVSANNALLGARKTISSFIHAQPDEIFFTASGTEANNMAILGSIESLHVRGVAYEDMHALVSIIEHSSIRECLNHLNSKGVKTDIVKVLQNGIIDLDDLKKKIKPNTVIVSIMSVNNEIGSIQPIRDIAKIIRQARERNSGQNVFSFQDFAYPIFHTDAAQGIYQELFVEKMGVDMLTLDSTKMYGPRGAGALYIKRGVEIEPVIYGGGQEDGKRSGTENLPGIMGFAKAVELVGNMRTKESSRLKALKEYMISELMKLDSNIIINSHIENSSPHILNVTFASVDSEFFILQLDAAGIACSTKSSCLRDEDESYVLQNIGVESKKSVRFSFGLETKKSDLKKVIRVIKALLLKK